MGILTDQPVQFRACLCSEYKSIEIKELNTIYVCTDTQQIFVGETEYTRPVLIGTELPDVECPLNTIFYNTNTKVLYVNLDRVWTPLLVAEVITNDDIDEICGTVIEDAEDVTL